MNAARLTARWHGHAAGSTIYGPDADRAVAAGRAEPVDLPKRKRIKTGTRKQTASPTHETTTEETPNDDDPGAREPDDA